MFGGGRLQARELSIRPSRSRGPGLRRRRRRCKAPWSASVVNDDAVVDLSTGAFEEGDVGSHASSEDDQVGIEVLGVHDNARARFDAPMRPLVTTFTP